ncbi:hypothetical protein C8J30_103276 [Rhodobacter viridis]|uniref:Flp pilus assembly pilin Flp n=1 Tax=Rhodobacter viridis TaxID=1054202 RepID=A0A318U3F8_9RHOB|nr:hypothetical protein [Rhodobacter viridis]PYF11180.1 hypothetical protein C8J30_103276 [Rhodobacter viridis]
MKFFKIARKIRAEEDGAVTVDWVVLTAAVVGLGAAALGIVRTKTGTLSTKVGNYLASASVKTSF